MFDPREARECGSAHKTPATQSRRLAFVLLALSLLCCEHLIGIDEHDFRDAQGGAAGAGEAGLDGGDGGTASRAAGGMSDAGGHRSATAGQAGMTQPAAGSSGLGGGGGTAGDAAIHDGGGPFEDVLPEVVSHSPDGSKLGVDVEEPIRIEFSEAMEPLSVETAYTQSPGRPTHFTWSEGNTVLTVTPGLERPTSVWLDGEQPGELSDLVVTYGLDARAQDEAGNPLAAPLAAAYSINRRVQHQVAPCLDLSGTVSASVFEPVAPATATPCVTSREGPLTMKVGDSNGEAVVSVLSFSLDHLPSELDLVGATIVFSFDDPVGMPHALYGTLWLEEIALGHDLSGAFGAPGLRSLGVLAEGDVAYPLRPRKDTTESVTRVLETGELDALLQFRVQFEGPIEDANLSPDYVRLGGATTEAPALWLSYDCAACP
jgi:hypothetical protein